MGKARYIYFNDEIDRKLQTVKNRSALICGLLADYFKKHDFMQLSPDELRLEIAKKKLKDEFEIKLKELQNG